MSTSSPSNLALEIQSVTAGYRDRVVLHDISMRVEEGDVLGLLGPNGAGKTTLLRVMSGFLTPWKGRVALQGGDLLKLNPRNRSRQMALVPQGLHIPVPFTVSELVAIGRTPYLTGWSPATARDNEIVQEAMARADLTALRDQPVDELSEGERQRALVAMAMAQEPRILLLDEPTAHLDIQHAWSLMELVLSMARERRMMVIMTSHDLNMAAAFCSKYVLLDKGHIAAEGSSSEVLTEKVLSRVYAHPMEIIPHGPSTLIQPRRVSLQPPSK